MKKVNNTRELLESVGDASVAIRLGGRKAVEAFALALREAEVEMEELVEMGLGGNSIMLSSPEESVLGELAGIAASIKDATVEPRVRLDDVLALHGQGEIQTLFGSRARGGQAEAIVLVDQDAETIRAEFLVDLGFRSSFRTVVVVCGLDSESGRAVPLTYWLSQYQWREGKLAVESSEEFPRSHPLGAKRAVAEAKACGGVLLEELLEEYEPRHRDSERERRERAIGAFKRHIAFLTGLTLGAVAESFGSGGGGYEDKRGFTLADALES